MSGIARIRFAQGTATTSASLTVAASDSSPESKSNADYICSGVNDEVTINSAIAKLAAGGKVLLLDGTYKIADAIAIIHDKITISGMGWATVLEASGAINFDGPGSTYGVISSNGHDYLKICDLQIDCSNTTGGVQQGISLFDANFCIISNVYIHDTFNASAIVLHATIDAQTKHNQIIGNLIENIAGYGINIHNSQYSIVANNIIDSVELGILLNNAGIINSTKYTVVQGNTIYNVDTNAVGNEAIYVSMHCTNNIIIGNTIHYGSDFSTGINVWAEYTTIKGNSIHDVGYGIWINSAADYCAIEGNHLFATRLDGIVVTSGHCNVTNNVVVAAGQATDNTYSCIDIGGANADYNNVQGNVCRKGNEANEPKYGILIGAAVCANNLVTNNDLYDSGQTADLQDSGTGTVTAAGNRT